MRGRIYDPKVGRFLTTDPLVSRPGFTQSWNPYSYVWNSPLSFTDPSGFDPLMTATGQDGVTYGTGPALRVGPGEGMQMALKLEHGIGAAPEPAALPKDAGRDDTPGKTAPAATDDGAGGSSSGQTSGAGGAHSNPLLTTGGGGANSGDEVYRQLTPEDFAGFRENYRQYGERIPDYLVGSTSPSGFFNVVVVQGLLETMQGCGGWGCKDPHVPQTDPMSLAMTVPMFLGAPPEGASGPPIEEAPPPTVPPYGTLGAKTSGVLRTPSGDRPLVSGYKGPSASLEGPTPGMNYRIKAHVEAHAAAIMRQEGLQDATLYINRVPCPGTTGCGAMLPRMLPGGARLRVVGPDGYDQTFVGLPDP